MRLFKKLFHQCGEYLEYIEGTRFPKTGMTGRGKVWKNYRCTVCGKLYTTCGNKLCRIEFPYALPIKTIVGGIKKMNENIDLTKILEGCPVGTKFYSTIYGEVSLISIVSEDEYPIRLSLHDSWVNITFTKKGTYSIYYEGECTLFPSKDQRDWSKFERFWDKPKGEKFSPNTLQPFDRVLARDYRNDVWVACLFSHHPAELDDEWFVCDNTYWNYVIPYNGDTKHLVGTKEDCPEYYKWWEK